MRGDELATILACAADDRPVSGIGDAISAELRALISRHSLGPLAHSLGVPGFEREHIASSLIYERQLGAAAEAVAAIAATGAPILLIKGISLATRLYRDPAERPMSDVDLLVPADAHQDAALALGRCGYWVAGEAGERGRFRHAASFKRRGSSIDLHRSIVQPLRRGASSGAFFRRAIAAPAPLAPALRPAPLDEALIILAHIARHELSVRAINYVDAARALTALSSIERVELEDRARRRGLARGVLAAIQMTDALTRRGDIPRALRGSIEDVLEGRSPARATQLWRKLRLSGDLGDVVRLGVSAALERFRR